MNLYAVELPQLRGRRRVDGVEPPRHRADAVTGRRRVDGVDDVASMAWNVRGRVDGVRNLISTQAGRDLPALRFVGGGPAPEGRFLRELPDARRAGEAVEERVAAFWRHRGVVAPSRHRRASSAGEEVVGGLFFDFEAVWTDVFIT